MLAKFLAPWGALCLLVILLGTAQGHLNWPDGTHWQSGNDVLNHMICSDRANNKHQVGITGTVTRITSKFSGSTTVHLQADDGAPIALVIPPQVNARIPKVSERLKVSGKQQDLGLLILQNHQDLKLLEPLYNTSSNRFQARGSFRIFSSSSHGCQAEYTNAQGLYQGTAWLPADTRKDPEVQATQQLSNVSFQGYHNADGILIVERLDY